MERETIPFTIPETNHALVLHTYITEREKRSIQSAYAMEMDASKETTAAILINGKLQDLTLEAVIVSVDGKTNGQDGFSVVDFCLALPTAAFKALYAKVKEISDGEKKTNS